MRSLKTSHESGFTLVELLVIIVILGILIAIAVPTFLNQQAKAHDASVLTELNTSYKVAKSDAVFRNGAFGDPSEVSSAVNKSEPELTAAPLSDTKDAVVGTVGVVTAKGGYLLLAEKSKSGRICTLEVVDSRLLPPSCELVNADPGGDPKPPADTTPPSLAAIDTDNHPGGVIGLAEAGDSIIFTTSEPLDPNSVLTGWDGGPTSVVVYLWNWSTLMPQYSNNVLEVYAKEGGSYTQVLGAVDLGNNEYASGGTAFGETGTPSTMVQDGNKIMVTLGAYSASTDLGSGLLIGSSRTTATHPSIATWSQGSGPARLMLPIGKPSQLSDPAGNPSTDGSVSSTDPQLYF